MKSINIKEQPFCAKGDGVTDDTEAFKRVWRDMVKAVRERARKDDAKTPAPLPYYRRFERRQRNQ